ncbi:MAG TPA: hypothetical protein VIL49_03865 [Capillimicrobium sp.]
MTREEAVAAAQERNAAGAGDGFWAAREGADGWAVVQVSVEGVVPQRPSGAREESRDRPEVQDDPRPATFQNVPPYAAG